MDIPVTSTGSAPKPARPDRVGRGAAAVLFGLAIATGAIAADPKLLPPEEAFRFSARALDDRTLEARFAVADGYYLYREKMQFALDPPVAAFGTADLPAGKVKDDPYFGKVETYRGEVVVRLPLTAAAAAGENIVLIADSQGCADLGVCYPANRQKVTLTLPASGKGPGSIVEAHPRKKNWFN
jgi:thiol:disulfide interchange protein DsbD